MVVRASSLAEAARRLLRGDDCIIEVPSNCLSGARGIALQINDELPQLLNEPQIKLSTADSQVRIYSNDELLASVGGDEPDIAVCWIPILEEEFENVWDDFRQIISDLLIAGYPGCIDCAGPAATEPWDVQSRRDEI